MKRGYTLIELLIVIVIISLITGIGLATYRDYQRRQEVVNVARQLKSDIRLAQEYAQAGIKPSGCGPDALQGYAFRADPDQSPQSYYLTAYCNNTELLPRTKEVTLPANVTMTTTLPTTGLLLIFKALTQGTNIPSGETYRIRISGGGTSTQIIIAASGEIR